MTPITLIDTALQPDPLADQEMGAPPAPPRWDGTLPEAITDQEIHDCRMLLVLEDVTPLQLNGRPGGAVALSCTFQPAGRLRFVHARLTITLEQPEGIRIIDLSPRTSPKETVNVTIDHRGRLGFELMGANVGGEVGRQTEFQQYHCEVRGSGAGDRPARWDFAESPHLPNGLANDHSLFLTLANTGTVHGRITLSGEVERPGLAGMHDQLRRWLRLGATPEVPYWPLEFEIPHAPATEGLSRFFKWV
ncbi:hypothetical protein [Halomonas cerina]|uniref:Uncharacterized protein n=1 Tax=Halomonas cerina TaxID=447424 RepID=A0A839VIQ4_9GAMM|nr:hypothetical protein [Halomonas cerina]MBB3192547.1 hypothetical protein [Halomonas cerina]